MKTVCSFETSEGITQTLGTTNQKTCFLNMKTSLQLVLVKTVGALPFPVGKAAILPVHEPYLSLQYPFSFSRVLQNWQEVPLLLSSLYLVNGRRGPHFTLFYLSVSLSLTHIDRQTSRQAGRQADARTHIRARAHTHTYTRARASSGKVSSVYSAAVAFQQMSCTNCI
jgi:hypothetical protein